MRASTRFYPGRGERGARAAPPGREEIGAVAAGAVREGSTIPVARGIFVTLLAVALLLLVSRPAAAVVPLPEFPVTTNSKDKYSPAISGRTVVWHDTRNGDSDIYYKNLDSANPETLLDVDPAGNLLADQRRPAVSGNLVVWEDNRNGDWDVYAGEIPSGQETPIATGAGDQLAPAISGGKVVWQSENVPGDADIYLKGLAGGSTVRLTSDPNRQASPAVSGNYVVWVDERTPGDLDVYAYDLKREQEIRVSSGNGDQWSPAVSGNVVVWADGRGASPSIYGYDLATKEEFAVTTGSGPHDSPAFDGETVVWEVQRDGATNYGVWDVYGSNLDLAPDAPASLDAAGTAGGVQLDWAPNGETDLTGYNVYRSDSQAGSYTQIGGAISTPSFTDTGAPKGVRSYYRVTAVDGVGNESAPASASAGALAPTALTLSASPARLDFGGETTLSGKLTVDAAGGIRAGSGKQVVLAHQPEGSGSFTSIRNATTAADGTFSFTGIKPSKSTRYQVRFAGDGSEGMDRADSPAVDVKVIMPTALALSASPTVLNYGATTTLSGGLSSNGEPVAGRPVVVEQRPVGAGAFAPVPGGRLTTGSDGSFRLANLRPLKNTDYRVRFAGDADLRASVSGITRVNVKARVSVVPKVGSPKPGSSVSITGSVVTAKAGSVKVVIKRNGKVVATRLVRVNDSRYGLFYKPPGKGKYSVKTFVPKTRTHLGNGSPTKSFIRR